MGRSREPECPPEKEQPSLQPLSSVKLWDAPILLLVYFHKAFRAELADLHRMALAALERGSGSRDLILDLRGRFEFFKLVYKYHTAAEDQLIFLALDFQVKNVVCTYSLEHKGIDDLFDPVSDCLNVLTGREGNTSKQFQELVFCISTIQTSICQHMLKEEKQVLPLLMQQFSSEEQALLIWRLLCCVPILLMQEFLPWLTSFLSLDEQEEILHCIREVIPRERLLQEVVLSWLHNKNPSSAVVKNEIEKGAQITDFQASTKNVFEVHASMTFHGEKWWEEKASCKTIFRHTPIHGLHLWHGALRKDLKGILKELYQIRSSNSFLTLDSAIIQLKFLMDVVIYYSIALDKVFDPVVNEFADGFSFHFKGRVKNENQLEGLQRLLYDKVQDEKMPLCNFVEELCRELELYVIGISEHLVLLETEKWLLYQSVYIMPLGLLKYTISWFSAHLSEEDCNSILNSLKQRSPLDNTGAFSVLLYEWVRMGYSGKTSIDKFRKDLQEMYKSRSSFLIELVQEDYAFCSLILKTRPCNKFNPISKQPHMSTKSKGCRPNHSSSDGSTTQKYGISCTGRISICIFSPKSIRTLSPFPKFPTENSEASSMLNLEPRPVDHIFYFHKALRKDLEYLVNVSAKLGENVGDLVDFHRRFKLVQFLYQVHSDTEDEIAFPALEAKGQARNISQSYTIDHKLEADLFNKISLTLDEISGLHVSDYSVDMDVLDQYHRLCLKLHDQCKSMCKVLTSHVNREEIELWSLFRECFSIEEQEKIIGSILGRTRAETLQEMIPWLMASLTPEEQQVMMSLWHKATKNTMFREWLQEWWEGMKRYDIAKVEHESNISPSWTADPLQFLSNYLSSEGFGNQDRTIHEEDAKILQYNFVDLDIDLSGKHNIDDKGNVSSGNLNNLQFSDCSEFSCEVDKKRLKELAGLTKQPDEPIQNMQVNQDFRHQEQLPVMSQEELEAAIRKISRNSNLDPQKKSYIIQNLLMSRWIMTQQKPHAEVPVSSKKEEVSGQCPSYRDPLKLTFGCKHYKRNCKLVAACCNKIYACRLCHDDESDHSMDRKATTKMMCMKCLVIQPIGPTCSTDTCDKLSMARYYCRICKFFDDERDIYHCPYCNLCRVGKGLGIDYFHCMNCNACMSRSLSVHICREKCFEDNCPICHEFIFTSSSPVKALSCGHLMHSACFQDYTYSHYTCPICSKSLGDMQVYFGMIDALLAEEKIPDEYSGQTQACQPSLLRDMINQTYFITWLKLPNFQNTNLPGLEYIDAEKSEHWGCSESP
ncbi:zinc finger protein BRUTUS-like At1g74770 isoform X2 [Diospyros lotus]|uniref:zinc finger protein BRUTUS-like At1g74770 isoform X2 n=1 Tax=Diospyros lotus TaxID=55363 RepID=UPI002250D400|nr:zinc finger protein BRUTUS-like At1g74770 isoform X2 [Diospyros lotus]